MVNMQHYEMPLINNNNPISEIGKTIFVLKIVLDSFLIGNKLK